MEITVEYIIEKKNIYIYIYMWKGKIPDLTQADTSYYQVCKVRPITERHVLLLVFSINNQKSKEIHQESLK